MEYIVREPVMDQVVAETATNQIEDKPAADPIIDQFTEKHVVNNDILFEVRIN